MNSTTVGPVKITYFGHASLRLEYNGISIYVDPYVLERNARPADIIMHTHSHPDHCVLPSAIVSSQTQVISRGGKFPGREVKVGDALKISNIGIEVVHAYNIGKPFHPKDFGAGYILTFPSAREPVRVYIAGDTDMIPEMENYHCDVAFLPIGGKYTMTGDEAAQAVSKIKPKIVIPYHFNYFDETRADAEAFKQVCNLLNPQVEVRILTPLQ